MIVFWLVLLMFGSVFFLIWMGFQVAGILLMIVGGLFHAIVRKTKKRIPAVTVDPVFYHKGGYLFEKSLRFMHEKDGPLPRGWYFWDETGGLGGGPYVSEMACREGIDKYCVEVLGCSPLAK